MKLVILESPFAAEQPDALAANLAYAHRCVRDCLSRGESPYASHLLFPGALDDAAPEQRALGIEAGLAWGPVASATVVYVDRGITPGMDQGIDRALREGRPVELRSLGCGNAGP